MINTNRYEVTAPMPKFAHLLAMDILYPKVHPAAPNSPMWGHYEETDPLKWVDFCHDYPHLFRLLKWWEHVPVDELPKYVKWGSGNRVHVSKIDNYEFNSIIGNVYAKTNKGESLLLSDCDHPATESEYTDYINKLNEKQ